MYNHPMNLERTPLLLERRHRKWRKAKRKLIDRVRRPSRKLPDSAQVTRSMDLPTFTARIGSMAGAFGPVGVGGIMRHS